MHPRRTMTKSTAALRATALLGVLSCIAGCGSPRFAPVDPADRDRTVCCLGTIERLVVAEDGTFALDLLPDAADQRWLAPGQRTLICELDQPERAKNFAPLMTHLSVGSRIEVCGYWIVDAERPGLYLLRSVTSIDRFVDEAR
ncbi:MAG: hypothetical protein JNM84_08055 [Planctomycetes bacterium]|nr:hypothetical protein [Planctomycetota bacterium]